MKKKNYIVLVLFLQSWIFFSVLLTTPNLSENLDSQEIRFALKTSSNETFQRLLNETRVNNYTTSTQNNPSICTLSSDTFAIAWSSAGQDSGTTGVYARVFNATTGTNITREFRVNHYTTDIQDTPSICALSSDTFAIAWRSVGQDIGTTGVYARVFNATTGNNITKEFRVNHYTTSTQADPSICALSSDTFAIAWESIGQDEAGTWGVYARVFNATTGNNITKESRVNHYTTSNQADPSICALSSDTFAVAWNSAGQDKSGSGIFTRVFNATTGNNITNEVQVNQYWSNGQENPSICALSSDTFAVAWSSYGQDEPGEHGVYARVFDATTGNAKINEFPINHYVLDNQRYPSICALSSDSIAVAWGSDGQDEAGTYGVYARVFDATTGNNITREFRVNNYTLNDQNYPSICALSSDTFAIAWESIGQDDGTTGVYVSVFGKPSTSSPSISAPAAADDDDDDDDDNGIDPILILTIVAIIGVAGCIIIGLGLYFRAHRRK